MDLPDPQTSQKFQAVPVGPLGRRLVNGIADQADVRVRQNDQTGKQVSLPTKEGEPAVFIPEGKEFPIVERLTVPEIPEDIEKVEAVSGAEISLPQSVTDDTGQVILDNTAPKQVTVVLPITEEEMTAILKMKLKVTEAALWLAERAKMLAKKVGGRFTYKFQSSKA